MYRFALKITPDALAAIARWLYVEMLKCGYTSVCEFHYVHHTQDGSRYPQIAETRHARDRRRARGRHRHHDAAGVVPVRRFRRQAAA